MLSLFPTRKRVNGNGRLSFGSSRGAKPPVVSPVQSRLVTEKQGRPWVWCGLIRSTIQKVGACLRQAGFPSTSLGTGGSLRARHHPIRFSSARVDRGHRQVLRVRRQCGDSASFFPRECDRIPHSSRQLTSNPLCGLSAAKLDLCTYEAIAH